jgi:hypothetical protein
VAQAARTSRRRHLARLGPRSLIMPGRLRVGAVVETQLGSGPLIADLIEPDVDRDVSFLTPFRAGSFEAESVPDSLGIRRASGERALAQRESGMFRHVTTRRSSRWLTAVGSWVDRSVNGSACPCSCCH